MIKLPESRRWAFYGTFCGLWSIIYFFFMLFSVLSKKAEEESVDFNNFTILYYLFGVAAFLLFVIDIFRRKRGDRPKKALILDIALSVLTVGYVPMLVCFGTRRSLLVFLWVAYLLSLCLLMILDLICDSRQRFSQSQESFSLNKLVSNLLDALFLQHEFQVQTKLDENKIYERVERLIAKGKNPSYTGRLKDHGFKLRSYSTIGRNTMSPIAIAKISTSEENTTISIRLQTKALRVLFIPIHIILLFYPTTSALEMILVYFSIFRPAKKIKKTLIQMLTEEAWLVE